MPPRIPGLFITGTDTGVGKTYVAALIAHSLVESGRRVGVYKPAASGCRLDAGQLISDDAVALWNAAGCPYDLDRVCPQRFLAPLMPHLAAREEGKHLNAELFYEGLDYWRRRSDIVLVEGAGGLMSPLGDAIYVADLAEKFGFPLIVVARNALGTINHTLQTLMAAATFHGGLPVAGVVLNNTSFPSTDDMSRATNRRELAIRSDTPILAEVSWSGTSFDTAVDWYGMAR
jgi:dethiobiotin synthetase